jgi:uncharacterized membrane protein YjjP (DUF1212 family)
MTPEPEDLRAAWQNQQAEPFRISPKEIHKMMDRLNRKVRRRNYMAVAICVLEIVCFAYFFFRFPHPVERIGALLTVLGMGYLIYQVLLNQAQRQDFLVEAGRTSHASLEFLRAELERQRDFHRGIWFWSRLVILLPGPLVFLVGLEMARPQLAGYTHRMAATLVLLAGLAIPLNLRMARRYQKQIEALNGLER